MKSGLLLVLAAAAVVLQVSESRIISKCELRKALKQLLPLPRRQMRMEDRILALVTCEVERRSNLDSNMVSGSAVRPHAPTTAAPNQVPVTAVKPGPTSNSPAIIPTDGAEMFETTILLLRRKRDAHHKQKQRRGGSDESEESEGSSEEKQRKRKGGEHSEESSEEHHGQGMGNHGSMSPTAQSPASAGTSGNMRVKRGAPRRDHSDEDSEEDSEEDDESGEKRQRGKKGGKHSEESSEEHHGQGMGNQGSMNPTAPPPASAGSGSTGGNFRVKRGAGHQGRRNRGGKHSGESEEEEGGSEEKQRKRKGGEDSDESSEEHHGQGAGNQGGMVPTAQSPASAGTSGNMRAKRRAPRRGHSDEDSEEDDESGEKRQRGKKGGKHSDESSEEHHGQGAGNQGGMGPTAQSPASSRSGSTGSNFRVKRGAGHQGRRSGGGKHSDESEEEDGSSEKKQRKRKGGEHSEESSEEHHGQGMGGQGGMVPTAQSPASAETSGNMRVKRRAPRRGHSDEDSEEDDESDEKRQRGKKGGKHSEESSEEHHGQGMGNQGSMNPTAPPPASAGSGSTNGNFRVKRGAGHQGRRNGGGKHSDESEEEEESSEEKQRKRKGGEDSKESSEEHHGQGMGSQGQMVPTAQSPASAATSGNMRVKRGAPRRGKSRHQWGSDESSEESKEWKGKQDRRKKDDKHSDESASHQMMSPEGPAGFYGLFQLTDSWMCDSGDGQSRNKCSTSCRDFTDDDITDDIECFVNSGYWRSVLKHVSRSCMQNWQLYFDEC